MRLAPILLCFSLSACGARTQLLDGDAGALVTPVSDAQTDPVAEAVKSDCTDPSITYVYVVTESARIYSFRPATSAFAMIGTLDCPASSFATPFSMGVDRKGNAYIIYSDGNLFRASTATGHC